MSRVVKVIFVSCDNQINDLIEALHDAIEVKAGGKMNAATVVGCLEWVKKDIISSQEESCE